MITALISFLVTFLMLIVFYAIIARLNGPDEEDPDTILIPPAEEPSTHYGEMVDIRRVIKRYEDE